MEKKCLDRKMSLRLNSNFAKFDEDKIGHQGRPRGNQSYDKKCGGHE